MSGVFNFRKTIVTFDDAPPAVIQPWVAHYRKASEMAGSAAAETTNASYMEGLGWQIESYHRRIADAAEYTAAQDGIYTVTSGRLTVADDHQEFNMFGKVGSTGVVYPGAIADVANAFVQRRTAGGASVVTELTSDVATLSKPNTAEDSPQMLRVGVTVDDHEPWDSLIFQFIAPSGSGAHSSLATVYFSGPAGSDKAAKDDTDLLGTGQYACKFRGDGHAKLYEYLANETWQFRFEFPWSNEPSTAAGNRICTITIASDCKTSDNGGSRIIFYPATTSGYATKPIFELLGDIQSRLQGQKPANVAYIVPRLTQQATTIAPARIDISAGVRALFQIGQHVYRDEATILDDVISLDVPVTDDNPFLLAWDTIEPTGTTFDGILCDEDGTPLATTTDPSGYPAFVPNAGQRHVRAKFTLDTDTAKRKTPTLKGYWIFRNPVYQDSPLTPYEVPVWEAPPALAQSMVSSVTINEQTTEPSEETAELVLNDPGMTLGALDFRSLVPVRVETEYNEAGDRMCLFQGYVHKCVSKLQRSTHGNFPVTGWMERSLSCVGEWIRLNQALMQRRFPWQTDSGQPYKITDVIRTALNMVYPDTMVDVPDLTIQLLSDSPDAYVSEPGTRVWDVCHDLATDFLGAYLLFDTSVGSYGCWRLLLQKTAPYNNLAIFEHSKPAGNVLPHFAPAYGTTVDGDQTIVHTFVQAGTYRQWVEPPEANAVITFGAGVDSSAATLGASSGGIMTQVAINVQSYNFLNLPPEHPYFPNGLSPEYMFWCSQIRIFDYSLTTQAAVDWKTRRVYERACFARNYCTFTAPLIGVTDSTDPLQSRPRPLRYYDPVQLRLLDDSLQQWLVLNVRPFYSRDHVQMAEYTLVRQSNIDTIGVMPPQNSPRRILGKAIGRMNGQGDHAQSIYGPRKSSTVTNSKVLTLPELSAPPIQDLDPDSGTFGQFFPLIGYDPD